MCERKATRVAYGEALTQCGEHPSVVVLDADLGACTRTDGFREKFPDRYWNVGIAEANMVSIAAGLATCRKRPFVHSFAMFLAGRAYEQIRNSVCYPSLPVVFAATHAGLSIGKDGATHQCIEDIALMRSLPNMRVFVPADANEVRALVAIALRDGDGPIYFRLSRYETTKITKNEEKYQIGGSLMLRDGDDVTLFACGIMVERALLVADQLEKRGIRARVINMYSIKPIDCERIDRASRETKLLVSMEEHTILGGLGSAIAEVLCDAEKEMVFRPMLRIGVDDRFGQSGQEDEVLERYGLGVDAMTDRICRVWEMRKKYE